VGGVYFDVRRKREKGRWRRVESQEAREESQESLNV